jgi:hypothetical protein
MAFRPTIKSLRDRSELVPRSRNSIEICTLAPAPRNSPQTASTSLRSRLSLRELCVLLFEFPFSSGTALPFEVRKPVVIVFPRRDSPYRMRGQNLASASHADGTKRAAETCSAATCAASHNTASGTDPRSCIARGVCQGWQGHSRVKALPGSTLPRRRLRVGRAAQNAACEAEKPKPQLDIAKRP